MTKTSKGPVRADISVEGNVFTSKKFRAYTIATRLYNTHFQQANLTVTTNDRSRITLVNMHTGQAVASKLKCVETSHE